MRAVRPIISGQWLARVGLVLGLAASDVVLAAICGAGLAHVLVLAVAAVTFAIWAIGRRVARLLAVQRAQAGCLARLREGALVDAEGRRRGMELMTTKLAHELNNPLAAIKSLVQVEAKQAAEDKSRRRLEVVLGEIDRIGGLLREYLDVARPMVEAHVAAVQLDDLMADVSTLVSGRAEAAGVELAVAGQGGGAARRRPPAQGGDRQRRV
jgi:signal transduction histidine kinase